MLIVAAILVILVIGALVAYLLVGADRERASTARRLKALSAPRPTTKAANAADIEASKGDPWLAYIPERWRGTIDFQLGSTGYALQLKWFVAISLVGALLFAVFAILIKVSLPVVIIAFVMGLLMPPYFTLRYLQKRHIKQFLSLFPDAIDLIVRAVRAGLPVAGALDTTGREVPDPVGHEFRLITADMRIGLDLDQALHRANLRIRLADFSFFVASLVLQRESGGNLAETLSILSTVLRRRAELRMKIAAMTSEAKTSAYVIGSLPFMASLALAFLNPSYIATFIHDPKGGYILGVAAGMLLIGSLSMRALIQNAAR